MATSYTSTIFSNTFWLGKLYFHEIFLVLNNLSIN